MSDNTTDLVPVILRELQAGQADFRQQLGDFKTSQEELRDEMQRGFADLRRAMREQHADLVALFSGSYPDHERRISDLETAVDRIETPKSGDPN